MMKKTTLTMTLSLALFTGLADAQTTLADGGNINEPGDWSNGLPSDGNEGTIAMTSATNTTTVFNFGGATVTTHSAGTLTAGTDTDDGGFNFTGGTWNMTGGKMIARYFLANNSTFNLSGGIVELKDVAATRHMGAGNGGAFNVSGSAVLDGSTASAAVQTGTSGAAQIDIAADWTGTWTWGLHAGDDWKNLFISNLITYDGALIDGATFDATFQVTDGGQTLSLVPPGPQTDFQGGDMLVAGNWDNGLPLIPPVGTVTVDGSFNDGAGVADWQFAMSAGTITVGQDWHFTGASKVGVGGGTLEVAGNIFAGDETLMSFDDGVVNWAGNFEPSGTPGGTIEISGGVFTGTANGSTSFGNTAGGTVNVSGGTVTASTFDFAEGEATIIGRSAVLSGDSATFGVLDILRGWSGSFSLTSYSGSDWETQFTSGKITLSGETLNAAGFAENFEVADGGQTLTFSPLTSLVDGDIILAESWSNGLPSPTAEANIAVDGINSDTVFGYGGAIINQTAGTISAVDGFNFNRGDTWNISGGKILARYVLANADAVDGTTINISGGTIELADVEGAQHMGAANGGAWNVSGSAVLDGTQATLEVQTAGTVDIASDWSGEWIWGFYTGSEWQELFLAGLITFDGMVLDLDGFNANFSVSSDGTTLSRISGPPVITKTTYNANGTVTLTWESRPNATAGYTLLFNSDLSLDSSNWADENDSIPTGGNTTSYTTLTTFTESKVFFVIVAN